MLDPHATTSLTFSVRGDELDRTGTVGAAQLLRYLENGRWQATMAPGNGMAALFTGGRKMVVRAQRLKLDAPVTWGEDVTVQTWLVRTGRTSVDIGHLMTRANDGVRVCEALLTGVQIDETGRPVPLPDGVVAQPDGPQLDKHLLATDFADALPTDAWSWPQTIRPSQTDLFRHVNHSRYVDLFEDARWFMERAGAIAEWQPKRQLALVTLEYRREAKAGDDVRVCLNVRDPETLDALLVRGDEVLTRGVLQVRS